jgi:hypothetical protein
MQHGAIEVQDAAASQSQAAHLGGPSPAISSRLPAMLLGDPQMCCLLLRPGLKSASLLPKYVVC